LSGERRGHRLGRLAVVLCVAGLATGMAACNYTKEDDDEGATPTEDTGPVTTVAAAPTTTTTPPDEPDLGAVAIDLDEIADLDQPVALAARSGDLALYIAQQGGEVARIEIVEQRRNDVVSRTYRPDGTALDLSSDVRNDGEQGLLGLTFSTDGSYLYVAYTGDDARQYLVEYHMGSDEAQENTRRELLVVDDPYPNHNGGQLAFGPDGYLYWAMGDGGGGGDPEQTGQDPADLLGSILRIDPDVPPEERETVPYAIPNGNPFAGGGGAPEVWAYGLRNPWRFSFDRLTGDLWIGDVGQDTIEEVDVLLADGGTGAGRGANLGWPVMEGDRPFAGNEPPEGAVAPLFTYGRQDGACSVTGGFVYRGTDIEELQGVYVFTDYCDGRLRGIVQRDGALRGEAVLGPVVEQPTAFGEDSRGELYVLSHAGPVYLVVTSD
jgi:glucose/arabinose dehydrogenase